MARHNNAGIVLGFLVLFVLTGCTGKKESVLARVDGRVVTVSEFNERISRLPEQYQELIKKDKARFLDDFIIELLCCNEAVRLGIDRQEDTREVLREARRKILMAKFIEIEVENKIDAKEAELIDYYERHKSDFIAPETYRASHILVKTKEKAEEIIKKLAGGADFEELAKMESMDITSKRGGDLGYFKRGQLIPEFEEACIKLETGKTSGPVKTSFGYHIIRLTDKKASFARPFEDVKKEISSKIRAAKRKARFNEIIQRLKDRSSIEIDYELIKDE